MNNINSRQLKHIAKIINNELGFTNGWRISDEAYEKNCLKAAFNIDKYLKKCLKKKLNEDKFRCEMNMVYGDMKCGKQCNDCKKKFKHEI